MIRLFTLIIIGILIWLIVNKAKHFLQRDTPPSKTRQPKTPQRIVPCAHCGLHIPESEALTHRGRHYCSPAHRELARHDGG